MRQIRFGVFVLSLFLLSGVLVLPQALPTGNTPAPPTQPEPPKDSLGRTTPRGAVMGFLAAARKQEYEVAAEYLNNRTLGKAGPDLARQLSVVLDRGLPAQLNQLSDKPEGSLADPLHPDRDLVGTIETSTGDVDIWLERVERGKSGLVWVFSRQTLEAVPDIYEEVNAQSIDAVLPEFLVVNRIAGAPLFEWLLVFVGLPLSYIATVLLSRILGFVASRLRALLTRQPRLPNPVVLPNPIRLLLIAAAIRWLLTRYGLPLLARQFWSSVATVIAIAAVIWGLILLNGVVERYADRRLRIRNLTGTASLLRLFRRAGDVILLFVGVLVLLHYFGVSPTAALAGLGVGGIAVALAAQKTLENVVGGVSMIFDQAVSVGDTVKVGDTSGTVDDIGLRSIRIRTVDRTVISIPNGQVAGMSLEVLSVRDKFWFHVLVNLRYETTSAEMRLVLNNLRDLLIRQPSIEPKSARVQFVRMASYSLDVDIAAYFFAQDWNKFLELQESLLLSIMETVDKTGVQLAFPSQTVYVATDSAGEMALGPRLIEATPAGRRSNEPAAANSASGTP